jgi:hypothetical protein
MRNRIVFIACVACSNVYLPSMLTAMTPASSVDISSRRQGSDQATGLFGGIRQDGTFVFLHSETKGIRFYRVIPGVRASGAGVSYDLGSLPTKTPIRIITQNGRISAVELQGVKP